ncbi:hypothetical protein E2562_025009 [Oryza meyeriana var. granulata]|uniref:DUF1618 domain-containing protein n=1 Tax=Oryza meyeriana var. granulata TaxID=110450 RepID=A0A6G1FC32_9ORYZ|nr:hypothetical protein E2562_025009 [Oryza meyeriana var. granulata]
MDEDLLLPLLFPPPLPADGGGVSPSWVYLDDGACVSNATTAVSTTSTNPADVGYWTSTTVSVNEPAERDRDITVILQDSAASCIKYVEVETRPGDAPPRRRPAAEHSDDSDSGSDEAEDVAYYWKANVWSMPIPVGSWEDWHKECTVDVTDIAVDNVRYSEQLQKIGGDPEETLRRPLTGLPTLGMDGNGISFLCKIGYMDDKDGLFLGVPVHILKACF